MCAYRYSQSSVGKQGYGRMSMWMKVIELHGFQCRAVPHWGIVYCVPLANLLRPCVGAMHKLDILQKKKKKKQKKNCLLWALHVQNKMKKDAGLTFGVDSLNVWSVCRDEVCMCRTEKNVHVIILDLAKIFNLTAKRAMMVSASLYFLYMYWTVYVIPNFLTKNGSVIIIINIVIMWR